MTGFLRGIAMVMAAMFVLTGARADPPGHKQQAVVWKSPFCGCCGKWVAKLKAAGFDVKVHDTDALDAVKTRLGVPGRLRSCHTAKIGGYVVEGHVPVKDVQRLLRLKPKAIGISVPGMPIGSPGMEVPSGEKQPYEVLLIKKDGKTSTFARHN